ncbi:MAG: prolyl oligopeptidase family serine peptidase [Phycisphaerae bacterium]|nr:prolyl oligopeptidase family serine peptidase [Phycisphaerae bacterium]
MGCQSQVIPYGQRQQKAINAKQLSGYLLYIPENYHADKPMPLIVFLHGAGERGDNLEKLKVHGLPKIVKDKKDFPFVVVSPQTPERTWTVNFIDDLNAIVDEVIDNYDIDTDRIYLTGLSMGGFGTWAWAAQNPERFAAIAPICGGSTSAEIAKNITVPIWAFHGQKDSVVPVKKTIELVAVAKKHNSDVKMTIYPELNHDSWTVTYDNPELYEWFLKFKRD